MSSRSNGSSCLVLALNGKFGYRKKKPFTAMTFYANERYTNQKQTGWTLLDKVQPFIFSPDGKCTASVRKTCTFYLVKRSMSSFRAGQSTKTFKVVIKRRHTLTNALCIIHMHNLSYALCPSVVVPFRPPVRFFVVNGTFINRCHFSLFDFYHLCRKAT